MLHDLKKKGFASIVEVIVTAIIFVLATAGILTTVSMIRPHSLESSQKVEAAYAGKGVVDQLRQEVDAGTWDSNDLDVGFHQWPVLISGDYNVTYTITEPIPNLRRMNMTITWPDP